MLVRRAVTGLVRGRLAHRSTLRTASQGHTASQGRRSQVAASPLARASRSTSPRKHAPRLAQSSTVGAVVRAAVRGTVPLPPIDKLRSVGEVLAAHEEHRNRYRSPQLAESWLALGQIVGHDQLEQQQLRKFPTVLERLTAHTLKAAPTLPACHLPRTAIGMARLQRVADNALWRPSARLWSSYAAQGSNPGLADPSHPYP